MNGFVSRFNKYLSHDGHAVAKNWFDRGVYEFVVNKIVNENPCDAFFVFNIQDVIDKHKNWQHKLPRVRPFYSVKANNNQVLLEVLAQLKVGFECVSETELKQVLSLDIKLPSDVIFANPIKTIPQLKFAQNIQVDIMTFDNEDELLKIANYFPSARLILRIRVEDSNSIQPFKDKYGCQMSNVRTLLGIAKDLRLNVVGVSFHVGCRASDATAYAKAIYDSHQVFNIAKSEFYYEFQILNIGGGFPGAKWHADYYNNSNDTFSKIAIAINGALEKYFPMELYPRLSIIAEPGTYYCASAFCLAAMIIGKRVDNFIDPNNNELDQNNNELDQNNNELDQNCNELDQNCNELDQNYNELDQNYNSYKHVQYYINDGVFGSFFGPLWGYPIDKIPLPMRPIITENQLTTRNVYKSTIWGQTLASLDVVVEGVDFPEMNINEWVLFKDVGDYSFSLVTRFCGFKPTKIVYYLNDETKKLFKIPQNRI